MLMLLSNTICPTMGRHISWCSGTQSCSFNDKQSATTAHDERGRNSCEGHSQDTCRDIDSGGPLNYLCGDWFQDTPLIVGGILLFSNLKPNEQNPPTCNGCAYCHAIAMATLFLPYAHNESSKLDWEGNMADWKDWEQWVVLEDIAEDTGMASGLHIPTEECSWDKDHGQDEEEQANNAYWHIP